MNKKELVLEAKPAGCIECTSHSKDSHGYPRIKRNGARITVARYLWEKQYGSIPKGLSMLHYCDNAKCVNIDHLHLGTTKDNIAEMDFRLRRHTKLIPEDVKYIKERCDIKTSELMEIFNVSRSTICDIKNGTRWKFLNGKAAA